VEVREDSFAPLNAFLDLNVIDFKFSELFLICSELLFIFEGIKNIDFPYQLMECI
jgi:hypothetical protein